VNRRSRSLHHEEAIRGAFGKLGRRISKDYAQWKTCTWSVYFGELIFLATSPGRSRSHKRHFLALASYEATAAPKPRAADHGLRTDISGGRTDHRGHRRHGRTLDFLMSLLASRDRPPEVLRAAQQACLRKTAVRSITWVRDPDVWRSVRPG